MEWYQPGAVVLQCGADSLAGDKLGCFNLTMNGHANCVRFMKSFNVPLIIVGGGGYTIRNVAKTWTYETGQLVGQHLDENLPFNDYIQYFGPEYKLEVPSTSMDNKNSREYLEAVQSQIRDHLRSLPFAPSVQQQETPVQSINVASLDMSDDEDSDLDERITQRMRDAHIEHFGDELSDDDNDEHWEGMNGSKNSKARSKARRGGGIGIAGGARGSAPWKHGQATADLNISPRGADNGVVARWSPSGDTPASRPKRSFFKARAADVDWSSSIPKLHQDPSVWKDDFDLAGGVLDRTQRKGVNGEANTPLLNGAASHTGSDRAESPMLSGAYDSPMPAA